jgi:hypothetical protein
MLAIVNQAGTDERMVLEKRGRAIADEKVDRRVRKGTPKVVEQRRREHDVAEPPQLHDEDLTRMRDAGRLHSGWRHSFAYCTKA